MLLRINFSLSLVLFVLLGTLPLEAQKFAADVQSQNIVPAEQKLCCQNHIQGELGYKAVLPGGLGFIAKLAGWSHIVSSRWLTGRVRSTYAEKPKDHAISVISSGGVEFFYLDQNHPERWKVLSLPSAKPVLFPPETMRKLYSLFEFLDHDELQPGSEIFITFTNPTDQKGPYRAILLVAGEADTQKFPQGSVSICRGRKFSGKYYETRKPLTREMLDKQPGQKKALDPDVTFNGFYVLDPQLRGLFSFSFEFDFWGTHRISIVPVVQ